MCGTSLSLQQQQQQQPLYNAYPAWVIKKMLYTGRSYMFPAGLDLLPDLLKRVMLLMPVNQDRMFILGSYPSALFDKEKNLHHTNDVDLFVYSRSGEDTAKMFR